MEGVDETLPQLDEELLVGELPPTAAVLFRKRRHMGVFAAALGRAGIPHRVLGVGGLLATPEATDLVAGLRVLVDPEAGSALIRLLGGARWRIGVADLAALRELSRVVHRQRGTADDGAAIVDGLDALVDARDGWEPLAAFTAEGLGRLRAAGRVLRDLRSRLGLPLPELVRVVEEALLLDVEAAANDARPRAAANLRAFRQQVEAFVRADDIGTLPAFLGWVDRALAADERLAPAEEPAERGVVQLLTVHAAKGLEWDVVAIPRLVQDEFPDRPKEGRGWLAFGALPYEFRGDAAALRRAGAWLDWETAPTRKELSERIDGFAAALRVRQEREERRLGYVAITRSARDLLLTASHWPGRYDPSSRSRTSRPLSVYLVGSPDGSGGLAGGLLGGPPPVSAHDADPTDPRAGELVWPLDPLGERRTRVERAAAAVRAAIEAGADAAPAAGRWARDLELLLAERARGRAAAPVELPGRVAASGFKAWIADPAAVAERVRRPMPEQPYRATRLGTIFHAWVEQRYRDLVPEALFDLDDDAVDGLAPGLAPADQATLDALKDAFERSEWANLRPIAVERAIELPFAGRTVPCKIDAVYQRGDRIEIVDWKTGRAPGTSAERAAFDYQLALYRIAWAKATGTPIDRIDARACFVATGEVYSPTALPDERELLARWEASLRALG